MNYNHPDEIKRMKELMGYRITEGNARSKSVGSRLEYKTKAANGKTYGILYEGNKFYIKEAPAKDTEVLTEDFSYIGGENNKKENEYTSYPMASKQLELKLMAIRESCAPKKTIEQPKEQSEWQVNETKEMRNEINRMKQIANNVNYIVAKDKKAVNEEFTMKHTLPEAPASNPSKEKVNSPFTDTAVANGDKDFDKKNTNPAKAGAPFNNDGKVSDKDMESDKKPTGNSGEAYSEKAKYGPDNSVAGKKPSGGKVTRADESKKRVFKLTEEQVLAWNKNKDFMDKTNGTQIGSSAPFTDELGKESNQTEAPTEKIHESDDNIGDKGETAVHNTDNQNQPSVGTNKVGDTAPFDKKVNEDEIPSDEVAGLPDDDSEEEDDKDLPFPEVEDGGAYLDFEQDYNDWEDRQGNGDLTDDDIFDFDDDSDFDDVRKFVKNNDISYKDEYDDDDFLESRQRRNGRRMNEDTLDVFGKHPAYRKTPMTTPPNREVAKNGARDWNDKSVENEKPFGQQIGDGSPFSEKVINIIADSVMQKLGEVFQPKSR